MEVVVGEEKAVGEAKLLCRRNSGGVVVDILLRVWEGERPYLRLYMMAVLMEVF